MALHYSGLDHYLTNRSLEYHYCFNLYYIVCTEIIIAFLSLLALSAKKKTKREVTSFEQRNTKAHSYLGNSSTYYMT